jgi:hypothetical protein
MKRFSKDNKNIPSDLKTKSKNGKKNSILKINKKPRIKRGLV